MNYWLCITNEENWRIIKEKKIWGVSNRHKNVLDKVEIGDELIFYLKQQKIGNEIKPSRIAGIFKTASKDFASNEKIFTSISSKEIFPHRIQLELVKIFEKPILFKELIPKLKFITNKKKWTGHLVGRAMRIIPKEDYELITFLLKG